MLDKRETSTEESFEAVEATREATWALYGRPPVKRLKRVPVIVDFSPGEISVDGGHVIAAHADPRFKEDLDVWVDASNLPSTTHADLHRWTLECKVC